MGDNAPLIWLHAFRYFFVSCMFVLVLFCFSYVSVWCFIFCCCLFLIVSLNEYI